MSYEMRDNRFSMFKNSRKQKDSQPDLDGKGLVICPHCKEASAWWFNAWNEESRDGKTKYISGSLRLMEDAPPKDYPVSNAKPAPASDNFDDEIPF